MQLDFSVSSPFSSHFDAVVNGELVIGKIYNTLLVDKNHRNPSAAQNFKQYRALYARGYHRGFRAGLYQVIKNRRDAYINGRAVRRCRTSPRNRFRNGNFMEAEETDC